jgi:hypothetical protein
VKDKSRVGRFVGFGCGLSLLAIVILVFFAKPLAMSIFDALVLERFRDDITLSVEPPDEVRVGEVLMLTIMMHNAEDHPVDGMLYVDLRGGLYGAFQPVLSVPAWVYSFDDAVGHRHRLSYELDLPSGPTAYQLHLRARQAGQCQGEVSYFRTTARRPAGPSVPLSINVLEAALP